MTEDKIRKAFDAAQIDPRYASYNIDSFSFNLGFKAALSSLEPVTILSKADPINGIETLYRIKGEK